jgi:hypothetical protein
MKFGACAEETGVTPLAGDGKNSSARHPCGRCGYGLSLMAVGHQWNSEYPANRVR